MSSNIYAKFLIIFSFLILAISCSEDESSPINPDNNSPKIVVLSAAQSNLFINEITNLTCYATDEDNDALTYSWNSVEGSFPKGKSGSLVEWQAPAIVGNFIIEISVSDKQASVKDTLLMSVIDDPCGETETISYEGETYTTVQIGKQCWIKENLNIGSMINDSLEMANQDTVEKYCFDNIESNCDVYGGLYQWNEAMQYSLDEGAQGICPDGWHLPTFSDLQALRSAVNNSGNSLKSVGQGSGAGAGNNTSGFSALLAGMRFEDTNFGNFNFYGVFWSSTFNFATYDAARYLSVNSEDDTILLDYGNIHTGLSIRCLKD